VSTPVEAAGPPRSGFPATAAFFDLDKTLIARSSTLAFGPPFYRHGLLSRTDMLRGALAQFRYRVSGADHRQMEKLRAQVALACQGWPADRVAEIVSRYLDDLIVPYVYAEARALLREHRGAGQDVVIVSTSGREVVAPIGALLGVHSVIATRMRISGGRYTGEMECYAYGEEKAVQVRRLAAERGYRLPDCYAYSDSATDLPLLEAVGHPRVVNPDRALRRIATVRGWPVLSFSTAGGHPEAPAREAARPARRWEWKRRDQSRSPIRAAQHLGSTADPS
jgi:HAD superfamily hydrolase (TIGR01490 family)